MVSGVIKYKFQEAYSHILLNRTTAAFFIFSFVLCLAQGIIQSFLFSIDTQYKGLLHDIIYTVDSATLDNVTFISGPVQTQHLILKSCNNIPINRESDMAHCTTIFDTAQPIHNTSPLIIMEGFQHFEGGIRVQGKGASAFSPQSINATCAQTLLFASQNIRNWSSEDLTFVALEFWLLGISVFALTSHSVAHLLTALATRALMTGWSIYSFWRTGYYYKIIFRKLYANAGTPCQIDFFSAYFPARTGYEIPNLVLNITGLLIACWLSWKLLRSYTAEALRYVGAPEHINRINKLFLAVFSCLQFEVFVLVAAMGLWIDVLHNTAISKISSHTISYMGGFIFTAIVLIPWICLGWYGIRREMKKSIALFFFFAFVLILGWSVMFYSRVYRWSLLQWPFLTSLTVVSLILIVSSTILGIICRLNFDRGLKQYLEAEAALAKSGFSPEIFRHDEEKNTPLELGTADFKQSLFSTESEYEQAMPTYLAPLHSTKEQQVVAQGAPLRVPRLAERPLSSYGRPNYNVQFGESF